MEFPEFKPIGIADRAAIQERLWQYQPETSELTFTNLFIWRGYYEVEWSVCGDHLVFVFSAPTARYALPPIGPFPRREVTLRLLRWLKHWGEEPRIERADQRLVDELAGDSHFGAESAREHADYLYRTRDLIDLAGRKYHAKRNYLNTLRRTENFTYEELTEEHVPSCLDVAERWCRLRHCEEDMGLSGERDAVTEALHHFTDLKLKGGVIRLNGNVEAFTLGEMLNKQTAVIHIEKADPDVRGLYALINQQFCERAWPDVELVNREQDLGEATLRETKLSYQPERLVEKFRIRLLHDE